VRVPVPNADSILRIVAEGRRIPATAAATARALPTLAKGAVEDTRRLGLRGTALAVTGAAVSGAASVATSLLARRNPLEATTGYHPGAGPGSHDADGAALDDDVDRFATAEDWDAEVDAAQADTPAETPGTGDGATAPEDATAALADEVAEDHAEAVQSGEQLPGLELPLPNFDSITIGSLRGHLRSLDMDDLVTLRAYEQAHAGRAQVLTMLENRIAKLAQDAS
jgi:hypothetical protein